MKKKIILLLLILISICAISHVSALEDTDTITFDNSCDIAAQIVDENDDSSLKSSIGEDTELDSQGSDEKIANDYRNIQTEIDNAKDGDTINLTGNYTSDYIINVNKSVTIQGVGEGAVLKYNGTNVVQTPFFNVNASNVVLKNIKFVGSLFGFGGAITWLKDDGAMINCEFRENIASGEYAIGGAVLMFGNNCNMTNCTFINNRASQFGGAVCWNGTNGIINDCKFINNEATTDEEGKGGGALVILSDNCIVTNCLFSGNTCPDYGGAISVLNNNNTVIRNCEFRGNSISEKRDDDNQSGGAIFSACWGMLVDNCTFIGNSAPEAYGGAISLSNWDIVNNSYFEDNRAVFGSHLVGYCPNVTYNHFLLAYNEIIENAVVVGVSPNDLKALNNTFEKTKINSSVVFTAGMVFKYGASGSIRVEVDGGVIYPENITVLNHPEAIISFVDNTLTVSNLDVGTYTLRVTTTPDENHFSVDSDLNVTVEKATAVVIASKLTVALKSGASWTIKIVDSRDNRPLANMKLTLNVYTGGKFKIVTVTTNSKGEASYNTKDLSAGTHKIVVSANDKSYYLNPITSSITVVKQTSLKFKVFKKQDGKSGSLRSFIITNKKTKKGINGVKIKVLIYTGKKYKTYILKTKKIKSKKKTYNGALGFATNDFSAGKHKVVLMPANIKYKGTLKISIKIKKSATKGPKFFRKL